MWEQGGGGADTFLGVHITPGCCEVIALNRVLPTSECISLFNVLKSENYNAGVVFCGSASCLHHTSRHRRLIPEPVFIETSLFQLQF